MKLNFDDIPLIHLISADHKKRAVARIETGCDLNERDETGYAPITWAAIKASWVVFEALVAHNVKLEWTGRRGETVADFALAGMIRPNWGYWSQRQIKDSGRIVDFLNARGLLPPEKQAFLAIIRKKKKDLTELIKAGVSVDARLPDWDNATALGSLEDKIGMMYEAYKGRPIDDQKSPTLLMWAATIGRFEMCDLLLQLGADEMCLDASGRSAADYIALYKQKQTGES